MIGRNRLGQFTPGHNLRYPRLHPPKPNAGQFQPRQQGVPSRRRKPGDTYLDRKSQELFICVAEPHPYFPHRTQHFKPRRLVNWQSAHGEPPPECAVIRILRDPARDELENLVLIRRAALATLNRGNWSARQTRFQDLPQDREIRLAAIAMAVIQTGPPYILLPGA